MHDIQQATIDALGLLRSGDRQLWSSVFISLSVSLRALALAAPIALLTAFALAYLRFPGLGTPMSCAEAARFCRGRHVYLHQTPYMFDATVEQNIACGLRVRGQSPAARQAEVRAALAWAGLEALAARPARELSLGEQQRVALTRAYVLAPSTLLLDEISANLDGDHRRQVHDMLLALRERATCVVFASHDPAPLLSRVDSHLDLDGGRLALPTRSDVQIIPLRREGGRPARPSRS